MIIMEDQIMTIQQRNAARCDRISISEWAGWFEGEEGWGSDGDDNWRSNLKKKNFHNGQTYKWLQYEV